MDWSDVQSANDVNDAYNIFVCRFTKMYDEIMPIVSNGVKSYSNFNKPWITSAIINSIHRKNSLHKNYQRNKNSQKTFIFLNKYKQYKNNLTNLIRTAEKNYYHNKFENAKNDIAKTRTILIPSVSKNKYYLRNREIVVENLTVTRSDIISQKSNEYFTNIRPKLAKKSQILLAR